MPNTLQTFLASATETTKNELVAALLSLPEDKRAWSPADSARTALDMVAECALNNGITAGVIEARKWSGPDFNTYLKDKTALANGDWEALRALLEQNTERLIAVLRAVPDNDLDVTIETPYGTGPLSGVCAYPYWNMSYHLGQINYIVSILGL